MSDEKVHPDVKLLLDMLSPDSTYDPGIIVKYGGEIGGAAMGLTTQLFGNLIKNRPLSASLPLYAGWIAIGIIAGHGVSRIRQYNRAKTDTVMREYIRLHPEDFPVPERVKWKDVFNEWSPTR